MTAIPRRVPWCGMWIFLAATYICEENVLGLKIDDLNGVDDAVAEADADADKQHVGHLSLPPAKKSSSPSRRHDGESRLHRWFSVQLDQLGNRINTVVRNLKPLQRWIEHRQRERQKERSRSVGNSIDLGSRSGEKERRLGRSCIPPEGGDIATPHAPADAEQRPRSQVPSERKASPAVPREMTVLSDHAVETRFLDLDVRYSAGTQIQYTHPFVGMILQVQEVPTSVRQSEAPSTATAEGEIDSFSSVSCLNWNNGAWSSDGVAQYQLIERLHDKLGLEDVHRWDYAYRPALAGPQTPEDLGRTNGMSLQVGHAALQLGWILPNPIKLEEWSELEEDTTEDLDDKEWWEFWLSVFDEVRTLGRSQKAITDGSYPGGGRRYQRMGERAFAAGSHGEVWQARRRCPKQPTRPPADKASHEEDNNFTSHHSQQCDDQQVLIMKRLKVEHGFDLLEAGLREIHFGDRLVREVEASGLFTTYVDHFFIEKEATLNQSRENQDNDMELWIVFENAGVSLRSLLYTKLDSGGFVVYEHSPFWYRLRINKDGIDGSEDDEDKPYSSSAMEVMGTGSGSLSGNQGGHRLHGRRGWTKQGGSAEKESPKRIRKERELVRDILRQLLSSASYLHSHGIVHRDIKPSNLMCQAEFSVDGQDVSAATCVLGDFSSAWDEFTSSNLYANGPSQAEQTNEYAPPEALFGPMWVPFHRSKPQSYDSWSIGVVALEILLGTPNVFSVDQRTTAILTNKLEKKGASPKDIERALYLAALSQFCIYHPAPEIGRRWPLRDGDPLEDASMTKMTCTLDDFHGALRARDPLGIGFDSSYDSLLELIWGLLAWDPLERTTASEALHHRYFHSLQKDPASEETTGINASALEAQQLDIPLDMDVPTDFHLSEFVCPKCGKKFLDHGSCQLHARSRRHAKFCHFDSSLAPPCLNTHSMLPAHPRYGYCDIQGRRRRIEDFHTIHLHPLHQFYGVFDGHNGNLASKFAASSFYRLLVGRVADLDEQILSDEKWTTELSVKIEETFRDVHDGILRAVELTPSTGMSATGTTATILYLTRKAFFIANVGDSRAVLSICSNCDNEDNQEDWSAIQLTVDHVASNSTEQEFIRDRGGFVSSAGGIERVNGTLAVSRSLGDPHLAPLLSRTPHVVIMTRREVEVQCRPGVDRKRRKSVPCFVILASDGLWDVISNQEAVDMVIEAIRVYSAEAGGVGWEEGGALQDAAKSLTQEAYVRGSSDNIGVCVVAIA